MKQVVIGLGFGDEGKGVTTNYLCKKNPNSVVIRYSGGQQAGHTVVENNKKHVFSNYGSGTLLGCSTYWDKYCTFDPVGVYNESEVLSSKGIFGNLYVNRNCPVTTPYDKIHNIELYKQNGTCGVGVGATWEREQNHYSLTVNDLYFPSILKIKLEMIKNYYKSNLDYSDFMQICNKITNYFTVCDKPPRSSNYIYESSQGILLDQNYGFFPHVTRSSVGLTNIHEEIDEIYFVTRAYQTRHGNGPMTNEHIPHNIIIDKDETNIENEFQGKFRRSLLDIDLLKYSLSKIKYDGNKYLVITCLDHILNDLRYTHKGIIYSCENINNFITSIYYALEEYGISEIFTNNSNKSNLIIW